MSKATIAAVEEAIRAHLVATEQLEDGAVLVDWIVGTQTQRFNEDSDGEFDPMWSNSYFTQPMGNPNAHVALSMWVSEEISDIMHQGSIGYREDDE